MGKSYLLYKLFFLSLIPVNTTRFVKISGFIYQPLFASNNYNLFTDTVSDKYFFYKQSPQFILDVKQILFTGREVMQSEVNSLSDMVTFLSEGNRDLTPQSIHIIQVIDE